MWVLGNVSLDTKYFVGTWFLGSQGKSHPVHILCVIWYFCFKLLLSEFQKQCRDEKQNLIVRAKSELNIFPNIKSQKKTVTEKRGMSMYVMKPKKDSCDDREQSIFYRHIQFPSTKESFPIK